MAREQEQYLDNLVKAAKKGDVPLTEKSLKNIGRNNSKLASQTKNHSAKQDNPAAKKRIDQGSIFLTFSNNKNTIHLFLGTKISNDINFFEKISN